MRKALSTITSGFVAFTFACSAFAAEVEVSETQKACGKALDRAYDRMLDERSSNSQKVNTSSNNADNSSNNSSGGGGNAVGDLVNKIAEGNQKKAELMKQKMEQDRQINTEQYKQVMSIEDKEREIAKEKSKLPIEIKKAEFERKKAEAEVRMKCQAQAQKSYDDLIGVTALKVKASQLSSNSLSSVRGSKSRMRSKRKEFYDRCMADPTTQDVLQLAIDELDMKLYNFNIQAGIYNADLEYTRSKLPKLVNHMDEQRRYVAQATDLQINAVDQQQQQQQMGLMFAVLTSAATSGTRQKAAASYSSADEILNNWESIQKKCLNPDYRPYEVPSDLYGAFREVNEVCRPSSVNNPETACVKSSGRSSERPRSGNSTIGN